MKKVENNCFKLFCGATNMLRDCSGSTRDSKVCRHDNFPCNGHSCDMDYRTVWSEFQSALL